MNEMHTSSRGMACRSKVRFEGYRSAEKIAKRMRQNHRGLITAFRCPNCRGWHLGNGKPKTDGRTERRIREPLYDGDALMDGDELYD